MKNLLVPARWLGPAAACVLAACGGEITELEAELNEPFQLDVAVIDTQSSALLDLGSTRRTTSFSGRSGAQRVVLEKSYTENKFVAGYTMAERSDDPCHFYALFDNIETHANAGSEGWSQCGTWGYNGSSFRTAKVPTSERTVGLSVCLNNARTKMKGFALLSRTPACILSGNSNCALNDNTYDERPNCPGSNNGPDADWEARVQCPTGYVVTGIELNHRAGGGNRRMISGARAICRPLLDI